MNKFNVALACAAAFSWMASAESYTYTLGDTSLGEGTVTITYDGETTNIATLVANTAGDMISISGDPITFADGATITLASSGTVAFAQKVTTLGATTLARGDDVYKVWTSSTALAESDPGVCAFPDIVTNDTVSPADINNTWECIHVVAGIPSSPNVGGRFDNIGGKIGNSEFVALNRVADSFVYSIRVQLSPKADGLYARCRTGVRSPRFGLYPDQEASWANMSLWASWPKSNTDWGYYGFNTDSNSVGGTWLGRISTMGLNRIILKRKSAIGGPMKLRFDGGVALGGTTTIPFGMEAVIGVDGGYGPTTLSQTITGAGDLTFVPMSTVAPTGTGNYIDGFITSTNWVVLAENRSLAAMTSVEGYMQGGSHTGATKCNTYDFLHYNPVDNTATCQFQYRRTADTQKYNVAQFRQNGPNVEIKAVGYGYANPGTAGTEFPTKKVTTADYTITSWSTTMPILIDPDGGYVSSNMTTGYGLRMVTATFGGAPTNVFLTISGDIKTLYGSKVSFDGTDNVKMHTTITALTGLPAGGEAHVRDGSLFLEAGSDPPGGGSTRLFVHSGGELRNINTWQIGTFQDMILDGGTYNGYSTTLYVNHVILSNAVMKGSYPRAVNDDTQHWRVIGDEPSTISFNSGNGVNVYGASSASEARSKNRAFRMDVMDVTGDSAVDCTLSRIHGAGDRSESQTPPRASFRWFMFEKYGAGTLKITGDSREVWMESKLIDGTLLLAGDNIMTNEVQLLGGSIAVEAGKHNDNLGVLTASNTTNSTITVGTGGSLGFASFAPDANLAKKSIMIDAPFREDVLKFDTALTAEQRRYFRWKDANAPTGSWRVCQDANGYLHPVMQGAVIYLR